MKYPGGHQSTMFVEQVGTVTALFDQWNDCERTVVLYALLKRLPFPNLKFLQLSIEYNIAQNINNSFSTPATPNGKQAGHQQPQYANGSSNFNKFHLLESNSNNGIFLTKLISVYKNFRMPDLGQPPPPLDGSGHHHHRVPVVYGIGNVPYETREDILHDILTYLPLLKPGNEEAKAAYISLVPLVVSDAIKQLIPTEMVQQILSYLLIHPAVTSEDRRSLAHWLHHLEEHINSSYIDSVVTATVTATTTPAAPVAAVNINNNNNNLKTRSFSLTPTTTTGKVSGPFAAINEAGPMAMNCWESSTTPRSLSCGTKSMRQEAKPHPNLLWALDTPQTAVPKGGGGSQDYVCDDHVIREFRKTIGRNMDGTSTALVPVLKSSASSSLSSCCKSSVSSVSSASSSSSSTSSISSSGKGAAVSSGTASSVAAVGGGGDAGSVFVVVREQQEDLHVSFSKNGTEILDFDCDDDNKSNTQIAFEQPPPPINPRMVADTYLTVPHLDNCFCVGATPTGQCALLMSSNALKTRRSNSLTTAPVTVSSYPGPGAVSSSTENLLQLKPRSYSLSIEGHRGSLMSCGSDTRLEEMKPGGVGMLGGKMGGGNPGMNCIGQWLKSLRLHKYVWLFSNITYEQMLEISEEYLANLSVTKGARHKLVLCIQKLRERGAVLLQMEQTLIAGDTHIAPMLEELTNIVLTPMKPIDPFSKDNIAGLFVKVIEMVGSIMVSRPVQGPNDEEQVTAFLWILERALHNEAFLGQMNLLKELKFKVSKIKLQFVNKPHFGKALGGGGGVTGGVAVPIVNKSRWPGQSSPSSSSSLSAVVTAVSGGSATVGVGKKGSGGIMMERKNSGAALQSFSAMLQAGGGGGSIIPPPAMPQQLLDEKNYFNAMAAGKQQQQPHQQQYSKSSSYPSFSQNLKFSNPPHMVHGHVATTGQLHQMDQPPPPPQQQPTNKGQVMFNSSTGNNSNSSNSNKSSSSVINGHQLLGHNSSSSSSGGAGGGGVIYHRHSMNSLMPGNIGHPLGIAAPQTTGSDLKKSVSSSSNNSSNSSSISSGSRQQGGGLAAGAEVENNENIDTGNQQQQQQQCKDKNNICDINSRLEFLCLQMTEQAIN